MAKLPSGTVTFLFTDIEGSTALWERDRDGDGGCGRAPLPPPACCHRGPWRRAVQDRRGRGARRPSPRPRTPSPPRSMRNGRCWRRRGRRSTGPLAVRMALHAAAAEPRDGDYLAPGLNRLARLLAAGHGGQMLLSLATPRSCPRRAAAGGEPARSGRASAARSGPPRAGLSAPAPRSARRLPAAPVAGHPAQQPARCSRRRFSVARSRWRASSISCGATTSGS